MIFFSCISEIESRQIMLPLCCRYYYFMDENRIISIQVVVLFEANYKSPENEAGHFEPSFLNDTIQQQHTDIDDDQQKLLDIEQNIANLEKSFGKGEHISYNINEFCVPYSKCKLCPTE